MFSSFIRFNIYHLLAEIINLIIMEKYTFFDKEI